LTWYDRQGTVLGTAGEPGSVFAELDLSPDGTRAAVSRVGDQDPTQTVWLLDFARGTSTRFTFGSSASAWPVWSPDGNRIVFSSNPEGHFDLYQKPASGAVDGELLLKSVDSKRPTGWSRDGHFLMYTATDAKTARVGLWVLTLSVEGEKKAFPILQNESNERSGRFSPNGRWIAYSSDESGRDEIYVQVFSAAPSRTATGAGGKWLISNGGGVQPRWRGDGKELYYVASDGKLMAVDVATDSVFRAGVPRVLFPVPPTLLGAAFSQWDVTSDGKRFLFPAPTVQSAQAPFNVVLNWQAALKK
jgi:Tol biopolymer transport system component